MNLLTIILLGFAVACTENTECSGNKICVDGECEQKPVFPLTGYEIIGTCLVFISSGLAGASGIGGGPLFVVFFITLFYLDSSQSVALSQFTIIGSSTMPSLIKMFLKHPVKQKPLIDFDIIVIIISPLLIGTTLGVIANIILPSWAILLLLTAMLGYLSFSTFKSGIRLYKKESSRVSDALLVKQEVSHKDCSEELKQVYDEEKKLAPTKSALIICAVYFFVVFYSLIKGSKSFSSVLGISYCSVEYWAVMAFGLFVLGLFSFFNSMFVLSKYKRKVEIKYEFDSGDIRWNESNCLKLNLVGFFAGLIGAIVGLGGGTIINPILIMFNVRPEVMTATSSFMIVFTSTISTLQFLIAGKIEYSYGLWTIFFSLVGSAFGVFMIKGFVDKYKRSSLITLTLAFVMLLCGMIVPTYGTYDLLTNDSVNFGFNDYC